MIIAIRYRPKDRLTYEFGSTLIIENLRLKKCLFLDAPATVEKIHQHTGINPLNFTF